jgi:hypothetical protein
MKTVKEILSSLKITKETRHHYGQFYDKYFSEYRDSKKVLEIGIDTGISIQAWLDYFPAATIYGTDITIQNNLRFNDPDNRVVLFSGDQGNIEDLNKFISTYGGDFDIIIDDGGHTMQQQQLTLKTYFPYLKPGGMYVVEDLHTSYIVGHQYNPTSTSTTTLTLLKHLQNNLQDRTESTEFISVEELNKLKESIEYCVVEKDPSTPESNMDNSEIAFIKKK